MISKGWPPELAFNLDDAYREAFVIQLVELAGDGSFDFKTRKWTKPGGT